MAQSLKHMQLAYDFISKGIEYVLDNINKAPYKSLVKGANLVATYNNILVELGYHTVLECPEEETVGRFLIYLIKQNVPLFDFEVELYNEIKGDPKYLSETITLTEMPIPYVEKQMYDGCNKSEEVVKKLMAAASTIYQRFNSYTTSMQSFRKGEIDGEQLVVELREHIERNYRIVKADTNITIKIPRDMAKDKKLEVYIPTTVNYQGTSPVEYLTSKVVEIINEGELGFLTKETLDTIIGLFKECGNIYNFRDWESGPIVVFNLDFMARNCYSISIRSYLSKAIQLGEPIVFDNALTNNVYMFGNYNETITIYTNTTSFVVDKTNLSLVEKLIKKYKVTTNKKIASLDVDGEKKYVWDMVFINSTPKNGDYNCILKNNVK